jgi:hypothetical protein
VRGPAIPVPGVPLRCPTGEPPRPFQGQRLKITHLQTVGNGKAVSLSHLSHFQLGEGLALMLRMRTPFELFQVGIAFVLQFLVNADLRGVIPVNRHVFDRPEEAFL